MAFRSVSSTVSSTPADRGSKRLSVIQDRAVTKSRGAEVSLASWAFLFSEIIQYSQKRVTNLADFEKKLSVLGYRIGYRLVELLPLRDSLPASTSRSAPGPPRTLRLLPLLHYIHTPVYRCLFNRPADALERSTEHSDEYMFIDNDPILTRSIDVPKEMSGLNCMAIIAGVIEAIMDGWQFVHLYWLARMHWGLLDDTEKGGLCVRANARVYAARPWMLLDTASAPPQ